MGPNRRFNRGYFGDSKYRVYLKITLWLLHYDFSVSGDSGGSTSVLLLSISGDHTEQVFIAR